MGADERRPLLDIGSVRNLVCAAHERALALDETVNAIAFPLEILNAAVRDERAQRACAAGTAGDIERLGAFLRSVAPVCEWLPADAVAGAWRAARELGKASRA
jgi:hypothetical protein